MEILQNVRVRVMGTQVEGSTEWIEVSNVVDVAVESECLLVRTTVPTTHTFPIVNVVHVITSLQC